MKRLLLICLFGFSVCEAQISFSPYVAIPTGSWPETVAIEDMNHDGLKDVVLGMGSYADGDNDFSILVYLQNGSGELETPVKYPYATTSMDIEAIDIDDMNNDGLNDVVIAFGNKIGIYYQNTNGTLDAVNEVALNNYAKTLKIGDLNNDGLKDIAVGYLNSFSVMIQSGGATFATTSYSIMMNYDIEIDIADVDDDGRDDVVVKSSDALNVLTQNASGTLNSPVAYLSGTGLSINGIALGDLSNDGKIDIAASRGGNSPSAKITILKQNPATQLMNTPVSISAYDIPEPIEIGDMNNDGKNEIVTAHGGWNSLSCYTQNTSGMYSGYYAFPISYASHYNRQGMALGDINGDGLKDVAIADYNHGLVILYNISESLGTEEPAKIQAPAMYPNPVNDVVNIDFSMSDSGGVAEISILNALGMQVAALQKSSDIQRINMAGYASGVYFVKVHTAKGDATGKIIKQ
ncbi:T9SS type A sorting domain-containing protein [Flavobacterium pallidum]|nr:T9SS type A sorting domain-containing protein [Flavobacterium pallidum]